MKTKTDMSNALDGMECITEVPDMKNADFSGWDLSNIDPSLAIAAFNPNALDDTDGIDWSKFDTSTVRPAHEVMGMTEAEFAAFVAMKRKEVGMDSQQNKDFMLPILIGVMAGCLTAIIILVVLG